jgi:hypothetical protein
MKFKWLVVLWKSKYWWLFDRIQSVLQLLRESDLKLSPK